MYFYKVCQPHHSVAKWAIFILQFPWVLSSTNRFDVQPWVPVFAGCAVFLCFLLGKSISQKRLAFFLATFTILIFTNINSEFLSALRIFSSVFVIFSVFEISWDKDAKLAFFKPIFMANIVYIIVALVQYFVSPDFAGSLIEIRTTSSRGVTSLAPEPTFFGIILFIYIFYFSFIEKCRILLFINALAILFLAKSSVALILLMFYGAFCLIQMGGIKRITLTVLLLTMIGVGNHFVLTNFYIGRISNVYQELMSNPVSLFLTDRSAMIRLVHSVSPYFMVAENFGFPVPISDVSELREDLFGKWISHQLYFSSDSDKTSSFFGSYLVALGFPFVLFSVFYFWWVCRNRGFGVFAIFFVLLNTSIPPATPLVAVVAAALARRAP